VHPRRRRLAALDVEFDAAVARELARALIAAADGFDRLSGREGRIK
jgi:hypothetical protein